MSLRTQGRAMMRRLPLATGGYHCAQNTDVVSGVPQIADLLTSKALEVPRETEHRESPVWVCCPTVRVELALETERDWVWFDLVSFND